MEIDKENIDKLKEALDEISKVLPPPEPPKPVIEDPTDTCICGKKVLASPDVLYTLNTGAFMTLNDVCKGCAAGEKIDRENARIVCSRCKRVVFRISPNIDPKTKFEFKAGHTYHMDGCALCEPAENGEAKEYKIIEALIWKKKNNIE